MNDSFVVRLLRLHISTTSHNALHSAEAEEAAASDECFALLLRPAMRASASSDCVIFSSGKSGTKGPSAKKLAPFLRSSGAAALANHRNEEVHSMDCRRRRKG